jgi:queuine tRNA-ribosyltransferase
MEIQRTIGAIIMAFDECTPYPVMITVMRSAHEDDTPLVRPMCESFRESASKIRYDQAFFPIVQGSCYKDLRQQSAEYIIM